MILLGVEPGITMVTQNLSLVYTIIWTLAIANVVGAGTCILLASPIARLSSINFTYLDPSMIMPILSADFHSHKALGDLHTGGLPILMRFNIPPPRNTPAHL